MNNNKKKKNDNNNLLSNFWMLLNLWFLLICVPPKNKVVNLLFVGTRSFCRFTLVKHLKY